MTKSFGINENNDLYIGADGNLVVNSGILAVRDACKNAVQAQLGEIVLAVNQGMPNFQLIWQGAINIPSWEAALRTIILGVQDVVDILSLTITTQNNVISYTATILTIYGQIILPGLLNGF